MEVLRTWVSKLLDIDPETKARNENKVLEAIRTLSKEGNVEPNGYMIGSKMEAMTPDNVKGLKRLVPYGTLYYALRRLEFSGALQSRWKEPDHTTKNFRTRVYHIVEQKPPS